MITLKQGAYDLGQLNNLLLKCNESEIELNSAMIDEDIAKLKRKLASPLNRNDKKNMEVITNYLNTLNKYAKTGESYLMTWSIDKWAFKCSPVDLKHFTPYNIRATDYINISSSKLVHIDYRDVYEIIAFDMMYRDLDETMKSMEEKLRDIGVATVVPSSRLTKLIEDSPLDFSKFMRIGSSSYASVDAKISWDYFGTTYNSGESFSSKCYAECVGRSVDVAQLLIAKMILTVFNEQGFEFRICAINEEGFYFLIDNLGSVDINSVLESVVVRAFGRKFEVTPKVKVF